MGRVLGILFQAASAAILADVVITLVAIMHGVAQEGNPLAVPLLAGAAYGGVVGVLLLAAGFIALAYVLKRLAETTGPQWAGAVCLSAVALSHGTAIVISLMAL